MPADSKTEKDTVTIHQIKSPQYQTHKVDGAIASPAPNGIGLTFFVERTPLSKEETYELDDNGNLGDIVDIKTKVGLIRELQTGVLIDKDTATRLINILSILVDNAD